VVLFPPVHVATAKVFAHLDIANLELTQDAISLRIRGLPLRLPHNDLQSVVCSLYPEVARHLVWLEQFVQARMSGLVPVCLLSLLPRQSASSHGTIAVRHARCCSARLPQHPLRDFTVM